MLLADLPVPTRRLPLAERPFLPTGLDEARARGWSELDVVLVSGDAYVDHPSFGAALIGRVLEAAGYRVGVLAQPDWHSAEPLRALGKPRLFFGVTAGNLDSMVNHYTAHGRRRSEDAYSPDGRVGLRPDRAATVYAQRCREAFKGVPVVLGGVEASLRRLAHFDCWDDAVRRSILFDAKADLLVYGQGERPILEVAERLARGVEARAIDDVAGVALIRKSWDDLGAKWGRETVVLPSFEQIREDREAYARCSQAWHLEHNPANARLLVQPHGDRAVVVLPPAKPPTTPELDRIYELPFSRGPHPRYRGARVPAWEQIKDSVQIVRGCCAGCAFCSLTEHQGREVSSRSPESVLAELQELASTPSFRGTLSDLGGPTANLWGMGCGDPRARELCRRASCIFPTVCPKLAIDHGPLVDLYRAARRVPGIKHAFVASGVRYDVVHADQRSGERYLEELVRHHVSGHLKVAPEHVSERVLQVMRKPGVEEFDRLRREFERMSRAAGKEQYLVPYFISSHPGCALEDAAELHDYLQANRWRPQQVQDFMPTPMTLATDIFFTGLDPASLKPVFVEKSLEGRKMQKALMRWGDPELRPWYERAMKTLGRRGPRHR
ncbi:MAG: YgiQ family radical SAM protein [Deltaproteobacteria bacterium]|nr:YgiQ family radical SAM protein [Deltaproteobacteria bacterium]